MAMTIKLKYVLEDVDRHGNVRVYFKKRGLGKTRLHAAVGTPEFHKEYHAALAAAESGVAAQSATPSRHAKPGTWRALCVAYFSSAPFRALDDRTQRVRRRILELTFDEPLSPGATDHFGDMPVVHLGTKAIKVLRDRKAVTPEAANSRIKAIRQVFAWGIESETLNLRTNPAREVTYLKGSATGFHSWSLEQVEQYEAHHPIGSKARLALALLLYTGVRRSDVVLLGRQHVRAGWLKFTATKGKRRNPITIEIPVLPILQQIIDASPVGDLTFLVTDFKRGFTSNGFGNRMRKWCDEAGLPPECATHGLRKAGAVIAAENGATDLQLMAVFGWRTIKEAQRYTRAARRKVMAATGAPLLERTEKATNVSHSK